MKYDTLNVENSNNDRKIHDNHDSELAQQHYEYVKASQEYTVDDISRYIEKGATVSYVVQWYFHIPLDQTVEPPDSNL